MVTDFGNILLFLFAGIALLVLIFGLTKLIRPNKPNAEKLSTYESGEEPDGNANVQFNIRYYVVALVFILFEVELVFLFPWATVFGSEQLYKLTDGLWGWISMIEMLIFVGLLILGLAYAWVKGLLDWVKPEIKNTDYQSVIPKKAYDKYLK